MPVDRPFYWIMRGHHVEPVHNVIEWSQKFEPQNRVIAQDSFVNVEPWLSRDLKFARERPMRVEACSPYTEEGATEIFISTIFLGVDHNFSGGRPLLFETMVFNGPLDETMRRYSTRNEAEAGHKEIVEAVQKKLLEPAK